MEKEIIINRMFSGEYLDEENNIGHEIINLYKPDNLDSYFIYLLPYGDYSAEHANTEITSILLVRGVSATCVEVLAKTDGRVNRIFNYNNYKKNNNHTTFCDGFEKNNRTQWFGINKRIKNEFVKLGTNDNLTPAQKSKRDNFLLENEWQKHIIDTRNITYGGKKVYSLFEHNPDSIYNMSIYMTFEVEKIIKVSKPFYLTTEKDTQDDVHFYIDRDRLSGSAGTTYYTEKNITKKKCRKGKTESNEDFRNRCNTENAKIEKENQNYNTLYEIINRPDLWSTETYKSFERDTISIENPDTFLSIIKKEDDELVFSNLLAYYFKKYDMLWNHFAKYVLKIETSGSMSIGTNQNIDNDSETQAKKVYREKKNIDLLIVGKNEVIVIENKIKSGINGIIEGSEENQLDKYYEYIEDTYKTHSHRYYYILHPNYNKITNLTTAAQKEYKPITYRELFYFFCGLTTDGNEIKEIEDIELKQILQKINKEDYYFIDFKKALKKHSTDNYNNYEEIMKRKMAELTR